MWIMGCPGQEVSEGNNISNWPRDHSCDILTKNVAHFCPCPENLQVILKSTGFISLAEEVSKEPNIGSVVW